MVLRIVYFTVLLVNSINALSVTPLNYDPRFKHFRAQTQNNSNVSENLRPIHRNAVTLNANLDDSKSFAQPIYVLPQKSVNDKSDIAKYRKEGNYHQPEALQTQINAKPLRRGVDTALVSYFQTPVQYNSRIVHVLPIKNQFHYEHRQRRQTADDSLDDAAKTAIKSIARNNELGNKKIVDPAAVAVKTTRHSTPLKETRYFHDIFIRYDGPQQLKYGHVEDRPGLFEQRLESFNGGNRYKGEVVWADKTGGYGAHRWNLVQGAL